MLCCQGSAYLKQGLAWRCGNHSGRKKALSCRHFRALSRPRVTSTRQPPSDRTPRPRFCSPYCHARNLRLLRMPTSPAAHLRSLLARPLIDQVVNSTTTGSMTATPGSRFIEALIKSIGKLSAATGRVACMPFWRLWVKPEAQLKLMAVLLCCCCCHVIECRCHRGIRDRRQNVLYRCCHGYA